MKLIQTNGQPHFGRFLYAPDEFNLQDYRNPFLTKSWQRKLRYKKFSFVAIQHQHYSIGFAIVDLAWVGHGFYYCYNRKNKQYIQYDAIQPLAYKTQLQHISEQNAQNFFQHRQIQIDVRKGEDYRKIKISHKNQVLCEARIDTTFGQPLYMCSPTGVRGWTFTHKSMALNLQGHFYAEGQQIAFDEHSLVMLDDSCGFLRPETEWFWLSSQNWIDGKKVGINLASGVNESCGNENCLWVDGQLYALSDVIFQPLDEQTWRVYSLDGQVELQAKTSWRRYEHVNVGVMASQFSQWITSIEGRITIAGQVQFFREHYALLEQHYAKW
ncbi:MAG: DUF2804 domain-containing protein [Acinetobacter sp.]|jgi:hypothetical protein|nr:MAG: DUF2804 domain-containing protein [Acinetobacter sp.]